MVRKKRVLSLALGISVASCALLPFIGKEFCREPMKGCLLLRLKHRRSKLSAVDELSTEVETYLEQIPELESTNVQCWEARRTGNLCLWAEVKSVPFK